MNEPIIEEVMDYRTYRETMAGLLQSKTYCEAIAKPKG